MMSAVVAIGAAALPINAGAAKAEPITLKLADSFPKGHVIYDTMVKVMIPALEKGGKIKVEYYPADQLGKMEDTIEAVRGGVADIGYVAPGVVAGKMPATNILSLPGTFSTGEQVANVFMKMIHGSLKQEYDKLGIKPIMASGTPPYEIFTRDKVVRSPKDVAGLKLRGGGGDADDFLRKMNVSVIDLPASQIYESLQRGVLDGTLYLQATAPAHHLEEVTKDATEGAPLMSLLAVYFMDKKKWDSLPPDVQKIIEDAGEKAAIAMGKEYDRQNLVNKTVFLKAGGKINKLTDKEIGEWHEAYKSAPGDMIHKLDGRGFTYAKDVYAEMESLVSKSN
jgi:TRAP-type C4-dicarboxylate transport system substrate-binding protein